MPRPTALSFVLLFVGLLLAAPGSLAFQCGNDLKTYSVRSLGGVQGTGIRCVKMLNAGMSWAYPYFVWYGEGTWGQDVVYRHVGHVFATALGLVGSASEFFGNGETSNLTFDASLFFVLVDSSIRVRGAWNEQWDLVDDAPYNTLTYPITYCGPNLKRFIDVNDHSSVLCYMQNADPMTTWIASGPGWRHLGTLLPYSSDFVTTDICPFGGCAIFPLAVVSNCDGSITWSQGGTYVQSP